jgi:hypothetical protein
MAGKIFINYRRGDDAGSSGDLFMDQVAASDVVLAVGEGQAGDAGRQPIKFKIGDNVPEYTYGQSAVMPQGRCQSRVLAPRPPWLRCTAANKVMASPGGIFATIVSNSSPHRRLHFHVLVGGNSRTRRLFQLFAGR